MSSKTTQKNNSTSVFVLMIIYNSVLSFDVNKTKNSYVLSFELNLPLREFCHLFLSHTNKRMQLRNEGLAAIVFFLIKIQSIKHS